MNGSPQAPASPDADEQLYGPGFWLAYIANVLLVCANSLTFRFAEFIAAIGGQHGTEHLSGEIVRAGLIAAILMRFGIARTMDRYGPRQVWLVSSLVFIAGIGLLFTATRLSPLIWIARIAYQVGLAGMFSCSMVHIQNQVPSHRRTEIIGSLGTSGFVGTIIGTFLSDLIFRWLPKGDMQFDAMFGGTLVLASAHAVVVYLLTRDDQHVRPAETPAAIRLLFRFWPGPIMLVAFAMGTSFAVTTVFLTRFVTTKGLSGIGLFFIPYSIVAFSCRWLLRDWGNTFGRHKMVLWGLTGQALGQALFLLVNADWMLLLPAIAAGFGHALLFPAVVSIGAGRFPVRYRGTGTTLVLGFADLGTAVAAPVLGLLIDLGEERGRAIGFAWMSIAASAVPALIAAYYQLTAAHRPDVDHREIPPADEPGNIAAESEMGDLVTVLAGPETPETSAANPASSADKPSLNAAAAAPQSTTRPAGASVSSATSE